MTVIVDEVVARVEDERGATQREPEADRPAPPPAVIDPRRLREALRHAERRAARRRAG